MKGRTHVKFCCHQRSSIMITYDLHCSVSTYLIYTVFLRPKCIFLSFESRLLFCQPPSLLHQMPEDRSSRIVHRIPPKCLGQFSELEERNPLMFDRQFLVYPVGLHIDSSTCVNSVTNLS